jgi:hypothetical protein
MMLRPFLLRHGMGSFAGPTVLSKESGSVGGVALRDRKTQLCGTSLP